MSVPELFDEGTGDEDVNGLDASMESRSESGSDLDSPPICTSMTVRNFFSKKRQRCTSTPSAGDCNEREQHVQRDGSSNDRVRISQSKKRREQLPKDVHAHSVTPNRPSGNSRATLETLRSSQSKSDENVIPRADGELNTSTSSSQDDPSVKSARKEQHVQRDGSSNDRVRISQSKKRREQLPKDVHAHSVTPNRPSGNSRATLETLRSSQSKSDENVIPRADGELNTSTSSSQDDPSVKSALKEITSLLNTVVKRVERVETELKKQSSVSSSSDSTPRSKKIVAVHVPLIVRVGCNA